MQHAAQAEKPNNAPKFKLGSWAERGEAPEPVTPRDTVFCDGPAQLYRFRASPNASPLKKTVLLVPSLINRWYVLDLRRGASVATALVEAGFDVFCLDWGEPNDEDRFFTWDDVLSRLSRMVKKTVRISGADQIGILGYCIGGTLTAIHTALEPGPIAALVNLAGPIDFSHAGFLGHMTNPRWFDPAAIAQAGNMSAAQMQAGFVALRPTSQFAKVVSYLDKLSQQEKLEAFESLEKWASDNIAFPAAAYVRYIEDLYQENQLVRGEHHIAGRQVDLARISCPVLTVTTSKDAICPPPAALALNEKVGSATREHVSIPGGHVGAVVGDKARTELYPRLVEFYGRVLPNG
ncbi:MAG: alpha/beta fold hydrolase [Polyangiaceae bacterium]